MEKKSLIELRDFYKSFLSENILPYWERHGPDREYGGFLNCMKDDGTVISEDKLVMSQGRGLWTFSYLYNHFDRSKKHLEFIMKTKNFLLEHGRNENGDWLYKLSRTGEVLEGAISIYSDISAIYGLVAYYKAAGDKESLEAARSTAHRVAWRIKQPDFAAVAPFTLKPGYHAQSVPLMFINVLTPLLTEIDDPELEAESETCLHVILNHHLDKKRRLIIEILDQDYREADFPEGRDFLPGDGVEGGWIFLLEAMRKKEEELKRTALRVLDWHLDIGWDKKYGGIFWWLNIDGKTPYNKNWDYKMWWCHTEALIATMLAFENTRDEYWLDWFRKVNEYAFRYFPDKENGE